MSDRIIAIKGRLECLAPTHLEVEDQSHLHAGHPGARDGRGHFRVEIVAPVFTGKNRLERHRMVYDALDKLLETDIHALSIDARAPEDARAG